MLRKWMEAAGLKWIHELRGVSHEGTVKKIYLARFRIKVGHFAELIAKSGQMHEVELTDKFKCRLFFEPLRWDACAETGKTEVKPPQCEWANLEEIGASLPGSLGLGIDDQSFKNRFCVRTAADPSISTIKRQWKVTSC